MTLPASQYSVLDAKQIERIDEDVFRCYVGGLRFLNLVIEPVLTVSVIVTDMGPTVKLLSTKVPWQPALAFMTTACLSVSLLYGLAVMPGGNRSERLLAAVQLRGSPAVEAANERFTATMTNEVRWGSQPASELLELRSTTSIQACRRPTRQRRTCVHACQPHSPQLSACL